MVGALSAYPQQNISWLIVVVMYWLLLPTILILTVSLPVYDIQETPNLPKASTGIYITTRITYALTASPKRGMMNITTVPLVAANNLKVCI